MLSNRFGLSIPIPESETYYPRPSRASRMVDFARMVLFVVLGFCIGSVAVGMAASSTTFQRATATVSYSTLTQTIDKTVVDTQMQTVPVTNTETLTSTETATSTATATSTSTVVSTSLSTLISTSYSTTSFTDTSTSSITETSTTTYTTTQTDTVTSTMSSSAVSQSVQPLSQFSGSSSGTSSPFLAPNTTLSIGFVLSNQNASQKGTLNWLLVLTSSYNTVAQGTWSGPGTFNATVSGIIPGSSYEVEVFTNNEAYSIGVYPAN